MVKMKKLENQLNIHTDKIMSFSFDAIAKAAYVRYSNEAVATTERLDTSVSIDYDKNEKIVGIEIIRISKAAATLKKVVKDASNSFSKHVKKEIAQFLKPALI